MTKRILYLLFIVVFSLSVISESKSQQEQKVRISPKAAVIQSHSKTIRFRMALDLNLPTRRENTENDSSNPTHYILSSQPPLGKQYA